MNPGWLVGVVIFFVVITWMPAGALGFRILDKYVWNNYRYYYFTAKPRYHYGWPWLVVALVVFALKSAFVLLVILLWSMYNFIVGIAKGGFPEWFKRQRKMSNKFYVGLLIRKEKE